MTNGEKIQTILNVDRDCTEVYGENGTMTFTVTQDWWNAEYKEPTTKNNLAVDCISRDEVCRYVAEFVNHEFSTKEEELIDNIITGIERMPPATPQLSSATRKNSEKLENSTPKNDLGVDKTFYEQIVEYCNEHFLVLVEKDVWEDARKALTTKNDLAVDCIDKSTKCKHKCIDNDLGVDYISRQAVLDLINADWKYENLEIDINNLPSVTPQEPKTGEWIENAPEYQNIDPPYICSECGNAHLRKTNYCDQCGARMIELQESEG